MRDGVRLAIDVYLPTGLEAGTRLPTILEQTRYWRSFDYPPALRDSLDRPAPLVATIVQHGYGYVIVDVRGTGASFGTRKAELGKDEVKDGKDVVDWIIAQPWSNGVVGATGVSYPGSTAELLLANEHRAVKAVIPRFAAYDGYLDVALPGGIRMDWFTRDWGAGIQAFDRNDIGPLRAGGAMTGVRPVDGDSGRALLAQALQEHIGNFDVDRAVKGIVFRDDGILDGTKAEASSAHATRAAAIRSGAAIYSYAGWWDSAYPNSAVKRFRAVPNPKSRLVIGPWSHGGRIGFDLTRERYSAAFDHAAEMIAFFDWTLKGVDNPLAHEPPIHYYTLVEDRWKSATVWPVPARSTSWYLGPGGTLSRSRPTAASATDRYLVDPTAATGTTARWNALLTGDILYPDRAEADRKLLVYDSAPLTADLEVTGHPVAWLHVASTATDGAFFVYLEDVHPDGRVAYVTEGELRAIDRKLGGSNPLYPHAAPYHSMLRKDAMPLVPGRPAELAIELIPTSYLFRAGHRIRIALAGADRDHFIAVPETPATIDVHRSRARPSRVVLPVVSR
jgi:putative CocE/NonD family hydrolase